MQIVGHSLGSHIAGFAGKSFQDNTGLKLFRIFGLDPAGPSFEGRPSSERLSQGDAGTVVVLHTDGVFGYKQSLGTLDFYANFGDLVQPGCSMWDLVTNLLGGQYYCFVFTFAAESHNEYWEHFGVQSKISYIHILEQVLSISFYAQNTTQFITQVIYCMIDNSTTFAWFFPLSIELQKLFVALDVYNHPEKFLCNFTLVQCFYYFVNSRT